MNRLQRVIDQITLHIEQGDWPIDSKLPSERRLSEDFHVSRATVREALMTLKQRGLIRSVQGAGNFVTSVEANSSAHFVTWQDQTFTHQELREYRQAIESQCAYLAATRADDVQMKSIERAHRHLKHAHSISDLKAEGLADARFHLAIAEASGNQILALTLKSLFSLFRANVTKNIGTLSRRPETRLRLMKQHTALFKAIYERKPEKARELAQDHMAYVARVITDV